MGQGRRHYLRALEGLFEPHRPSWVGRRAHACPVRWRSIQIIRHEAERTHLCGHLQRGAWNQIHYIADQSSAHRVTRQTLGKVRGKDEQMRNHNRGNQVRVRPERRGRGEDAEGHRARAANVRKKSRHNFYLLRCTRNP